MFQTRQIYILWKKLFEPWVALFHLFDAAIHLEVVGKPSDALRAAPGLRTYRFPER